MKRVITGERNGKSTFVDVTEVDEDKALSTGGMDIWGLWAQQGTPKLPFDGAEQPAVEGFYPPPGEVRMTLIRFGADLAVDSVEENEVADLMDDEGTHATDTLDVGWIISGELGLELDNGEIEWLQQGDMLIQNGTIHKWHNRSGSPALTGWVVLGAERG